MKTVLEIEASIKQLPISLQDVDAGKLDDLIAKAESDIQANRVRDLDEVLDNM